MWPHPPPLCIVSDSWGLPLILRCLVHYLFSFSWSAPKQLHQMHLTIFLNLTKPNLAWFSLGTSDFFSTPSNSFSWYSMSNLREIYNFDSDLSTLSYSLIQYLFILIIYTREIIFSIVKYPIKKCFHRKYLKKLHLIIYINVQGKENFWKCKVKFNALYWYM